MNSTQSLDATQHDEGASMNPLPAYSGPDALRAPILKALRSVVDPEVAMNILDVGLVYRVTVDERKLHLQVTMTSAACPVADVILDDIESALEHEMPAEIQIEVEVVWEPPWTSDNMSDEAKRFMGW